MEGAGKCCVASHSAGEVGEEEEGGVVSHR